MNRRQILKSLLSLSALAIATPWAWAKDKMPKNLADPKKGMPMAMKYVHLGADAAKNPQTKNIYKLGSTCANCSRFNKCSAADKACKPVAKTAKYAPCDIFSGQVVDRNGWCMSWTKA